MTAPILFDVPGPKARRRNLIGTVVGVALILALIGYVLLKLAGNGQLEAQRWAILFDTRAAVPQALLRGLVATLQVAALGMVLATVLGALLAIGRLSDHRWVRSPVATIIEFFRAVPLLVLIFAVFFVAPTLGLPISAFAALVTGLTLYNMAVIAEIVRAGILSIDKGQSEAAFGIGMRKWQVMTFVLLPQAIRRMLPVLIAQLVVLLKDSSLGFIIGYFELLRSARSLVEFFRLSFGDQYSFQIYVAAALIYILVNVILSAFARWLDKRLARSKKSPAGETLPLTAEQFAAGGGGLGAV
ncbi:MAG: amino acid ABC transporter permease [Geodermatophilaceae bacterium]|nr:amino acid ABC transporter permease [Geodermatophilaceae bacterium]